MDTASQTSVSERLAQIVEASELSKSQFARTTGLSPQNVYDFISGRKGDPSYGVIKKILDRYPNINANWLISGSGSMLNDSTHSLYADESAHLDVTQYMEQIIKQSETQLFNNIPSGILALDRITHGWRKSSLYIVAGAPSMGCTSLLLTFMRNALAFGYPHQGFAFFSMQMRREKILTKWLSLETELSYQTIEGGDIPDQKWSEITRFWSSWNEKANKLLHIIDTPTLSIEQIEAQCGELSERGAKLFLIDNLECITVENAESHKISSHQQEKLHIIKRLRVLAYNLNAPVIIVVSTNRSTPQRQSFSRPQLSDLQELEGCEKEADGIVIVHRPEYYGITEDELGISTHNTAELIVAKNSLGETDTALVQFISECGLFRDFINDWRSNSTPSSFTLGLGNIENSTSNQSSLGNPPF